MKSTLRKQALILTAANVATRGIGFAMRLLFARCMQAEALGVMEMASSVSMLAMTPVTAGIPTAMSHLSAKKVSKADQTAVLHAGVDMVSRMSWMLMPAMLVLSPAAAWLLGDLRTLPTIWAGIPAILLCGLCGVYGGYCFGTGRAQLPARFECLEQCVRFCLAAVLLMLMQKDDLSITAALPVIAESVSALLVVCLFRRAISVKKASRESDEQLQRMIWQLAWPMILARFCVTGTRMMNAVLLPLCLRRSGLSASAATAQYGLLTGMAMPLMMLPGVVTGALCTVSTPVVSKLDGKPSMRRMIRKLYGVGFGIGVAAAAGLFVFSSFIGQSIYHQPALSPLIRVMTPITLLASVRQVQFGVVAGLGLQRKALMGTIASSAISLIVSAWLVPLPSLRLYGAALAMILGQCVAVLWNAAILRCSQRKTSAQAA